MRLLGFVFFASTLSAQWLHHLDPDLPRLAEGGPKLDAPVWKWPDGRPDLSGVWIPAPDPNGPRGGVENGIPPKYFVSLAGGFNPGDLPMVPWAAELFASRRANAAVDQPVTSCLPSGPAWAAAFPSPYKIVQTARVILLLYEQENVFRQVFMDGRKFPEDPQPSYLGYSVGPWDGDTLVVTTTGFKDLGWLDGMGHPHSDEMVLEERFQRLDIGHMDLQITIRDPKTYTRPLVYTQPQTLLPDTDLMEYFCAENEKDAPHLIRK